jgi:hypothetical protein
MVVRGTTVAARPRAFASAEQTVTAKVLPQSLGVRYMYT